MYSRVMPFQFPRLIETEELKRKRPVEKCSCKGTESCSECGKTYKIKRIQGYRLDWTGFDAKFRNDYYKKETKNGAASDPDYIDTLPTEYKWVEDVDFAIPDTYLYEIRKNVNQAVDIWSIRRPFDTMIREICLAPAIAHISVAFKLLADCIFDKKTSNYKHSDEPYASIFLYKFWFYQTGCGLIEERAELSRLAEFSRLAKVPKFTKWITKATDHLRLMQEAHAERYQGPKVKASLSGEPENQDEVKIVKDVLFGTGDPEKITNESPIESLEEEILKLIPWAYKIDQERQTVETIVSQLSTLFGAKRVSYVLRKMLSEGKETITCHPEGYLIRCCLEKGKNDAESW